MTCKANLMKNKTLSSGKNFLEDTKNYQNKKWLKEKDKLNDLKEYLSTSKTMLGKSVIDLDKIKEIVSDIESSLPLELEQSRVIISQKESILTDASDEAEKLTAETSEHCENLITDAQSRAEHMVSESEIISSAEKRLSLIHISEPTRPY